MERREFSAKDGVVLAVLSIEHIQTIACTVNSLHVTDPSYIYMKRYIAIKGKGDIIIFHQRGNRVHSF